MTDQTIFRSTSPEVLAMWEGYSIAKAVQADVIDTLVRSGDLAEGYDIPVTSGDRLIGVAREHGLYSRPKDMPPGWKYEKAGYLAPKADKPGREIAARMAEANIVDDIRDLWPGMIHSCSRGMVWFARPQAEFHDGAVFAVWPIPIDDKASPATCGDTPKAIDPAIWERVPLSAYHAAKELAEGSPR